jgi:DNA-binding beta-propeller fold protein YncE
MTTGIGRLRQQMVIAALVIGLVFVIGLAIASSGARRRSSARHSSASRAVQTSLTRAQKTAPAGPKLVSYEAMSAASGGWECVDDEAVQLQMPLRASLEMERIAERNEESVDEKALTAVAGSTVKITSKPVREIRDSYYNFSGVAVDASRNEVVLTDESLFNLLTYDRLSNTPPTSKTEPKHSLGGLNTNIEFQASVYIDPTNGDMYAVNNDTVDQLVIFSHDQQGDVAPIRQVYTPHGTFAITVDENTQRMFLTVQHDSAVVVYDKHAHGEDAPLALIQGDKTRLADPHGIALDPQRHLLYVANHGSVHSVLPGDPEGRRKGLGHREGKQYWPASLDNAVPGSGHVAPSSITVYAEDTNGDVPPVRYIEGPHTQLNWPTGIALNTEDDELFVANDGGNSLLVFKASASGDAAPIRVVKGPKSLISFPTGAYYDAKNHELWVANFGNHTANAYDPKTSGDSPPLRVIRSAPAGIPAPGMGNPHPIAYDPKRQQILVPNCVARPRIAAFDRMADGEADPKRSIEGWRTMLGRTMHGIAYDPYKDEFTVPQQFAQAILTFRGGANGEEAPIRVIQGPHTKLRSPDLMAEDPVHREIFVTESNTVYVYPLDASGDIAPIRTLSGPATKIPMSDAQVTVDPVHDLLIVAGRSKTGGEFLIFNRTDEGNVAPKAIIGGPNSLIFGFGGPFTVYPPKGEIIATIRGGGPHANLSSEDAFVGVWNINDNGDVAPKWTIGGPHGELRMPRGVTLDAKHKSLLVTDKRLNAVLTYYFPEIF